MKPFSNKDLSKAIKKIDKRMDEDRKNNPYLPYGIVRPINPDHQYSTFGLRINIGPPGVGKTTDDIRHLQICEEIGPRGYYNKIIVVSPAGNLDETRRTFEKRIKKQRVISIPPEALVTFINQHEKQLEEFYAMYKHLMSEFKDSDSKVNEIIQKNKLEDEIERLAFFANRFEELKMYDYPVNVYIQMDDAAGNEMLNKRNSDVIKALKKCRHMHMTISIAVQTISDIMKDLKRLVFDVVLYKGLSREDLMTILEHIPIPADYTKEQLIDMYNSLKGSHPKLILHNTANKAIVVNSADE